MVLNCGENDSERIKPIYREKWKETQRKEDFRIPTSISDWASFTENKGDLLVWIHLP